MLSALPGPADTFRQAAQLIKAQRNLLAKLKNTRLKNRRGNSGQPPDQQ
jgi:hypothetical protein